MEWVGEKTFDELMAFVAQDRGAELQQELAARQAKYFDPKIEYWNVPLIRSAKLGDDFADEIIERPTDQRTLTRRYTEEAVRFIEAPSGDKELGEDTTTGLPVFAKAGRFGPYVQLGELVDGEDKPQTASLFKDMDLETVTLEQATQLLSLPRVVGVDPEDGQEITAQNGRYGPYLKKGKDSRTIECEALLF